MIKFKEFGRKNELLNYLYILVNDNKIINNLDEIRKIYSRFYCYTDNKNLSNDCLSNIYKNDIFYLIQYKRRIENAKTRI